MLIPASLNYTEFLPPATLYLTSLPAIISPSARALPAAFGSALLSLTDHNIAEKSLVTHSFFREALLGLVSLREGPLLGAAFAAATASITNGIRLLFGGSEGLSPSSHVLHPHVPSAAIILVTDEFID